MKCDKLQSGKWECVADGPRDPATNKRNQIRRRGKTKAEAKGKVEAALRDLKEHGVNDKQTKGILFDQVAEEWFKVYSVSGNKKSTLHIRKNAMETLYKYLKKVPIRQINHRAIQNLILELNDQGYSRAWLESVKVTANLIFKHAKKNNLRIDNPAADIVIPQNRQTVEEIENTGMIAEKFLERHELELLLQATVTHGLPLDMERFYLLAFTGMRPSELCALRWSDINFETDEVRITKTLYMPNAIKDYETTPPKSKAGIRMVQVDSSIMKMLKNLKVQQAKERLATSSPRLHDQQYVFCRPNGYPYSWHTLSKRLRRLSKYVNIEKQLTPHIFRHTHISMLAEAEVNLHAIMDRVGHEDSKVTTQVYTHVSEKMKKNTSESLKKHFGDILDLPIPMQK